jgi:glycosyltransferase involved in cell wall biosynthesis
VKLSIIIPCLNAADTIGIQLDALSNQKWSEPWEVIVSDNGSTDDSMKIVKRYSDRLPKLCIVDSSDRKCRPYACNVGARAAKGEFLAFCDADDEVAPGWLPAIGEALSKCDFVASRFDVEKLNTSEIQKYNKKHQQQYGLPRLCYPPYLPHSGGSGLGVKRSIHESVGGFDESWFRLADTEYCLRIQLKGYKLHFVSEAVIHIRFRSNFKRVFNQGRLWGKYNTRMYKKYHNPKMKILNPWKWYIRDWVKLIMNVPHIHDKTEGARWLFRAGWQIGLFQGSIRYRFAPAVYAPVKARIGFDKFER